MNGHTSQNATDTFNPIDPCNKMVPITISIENNAQIQVHRPDLPLGRGGKDLHVNQIPLKKYLVNIGLDSSYMRRFYFFLRARSHGITRGRSVRWLQE